MLWREGYAPRYRPDGSAPLLAGRTLNHDLVEWTGPTVAFADFGAMATVGLWGRLFRSEALPYRVALLGLSPRTARDLFAPSERGSVVVPTDEDAWREFFPAEADGSTVATVRCGTPGFLLIGPPTEDAWERFVKEIRAEPSRVA